MTRPHHDEPPRRCCRDSENGVILGVCAGLARHFDWPLWITRLGMLALGWIFPVPVLAGYLLAALLMPPRALHYSGEGEERRFWQTRGHGS